MTDRSHSSSSVLDHHAVMAARRYSLRTSRVVLLVSVLPLLLYAASIWLVRPFAMGDTFSLTLAAPGLLVIGVMLVRIPRGYALDRLRSVRFEFSLLLLIIALSLLSVVNSESPIRSFRIIFPSALPFAVFAHLLVIGYVSPERLRQIPRVLIAGAFLFSMLPLLLSLGVGSLKDFIYEEYRVRAGFENAIQHSIALATIVPLVVVELALAKRLRVKAAWGCFLLLLAYASFQAGSKSAMAVAFATGLVLYLLLAFETRDFRRILVVFVGVSLLALLLWAFGLTIAEKLSPIVAEKIRAIIEGGVTNYQSIESRRMLWAEAIHQGRTHWLIGTGAGEKILGVPHSHNLVLDYFKGIGIFGAIAIALLCLSILLRTGAQSLRVLRGGSGENRIRALACFFGASNYVICNQLSDCFGPSTVGFLWLIFLTGVFLEKQGKDTRTGAQTQASISR